MKNNLKAPILAVLGVASLAVAIPMSVASAQDQQPRQGVRTRVIQAPQEGNFPRRAGGGEFDQQPMPNMMPRMGMGGSPVMIDDEDSLYILAGNRIFKVDKSNLEVEAEGMLPMGPPPGGFGEGGGFGGPPEGGQPPIRERRGGGGGEVRLPGDPEPPTE